MQLVDADTAQPGLTIITREQTSGKGQRGRKWNDNPGDSLLTSIICTPPYDIQEQFIFNAHIAVAVAEVLNDIYEGWDVRIKWPNDIIINDRKAGGILIENVLRGSNWSYSIIGLGLNVNQSGFPPELPFATSLYIASGKAFDITGLLHKIRNAILSRIAQHSPGSEVMHEYNEYLYRKDHEQKFTDGSQEWKAIIKSAGSNGLLQVQLADGSILHYKHGDALWKWE